MALPTHCGEEQTRPGYTGPSLQRTLSPDALALYSALDVARRSGTDTVFAAPTFPSYAPPIIAQAQRPMAPLDPRGAARELIRQNIATSQILREPARFGFADTDMSAGHAAIFARHIVRCEPPLPFWEPLARSLLRRDEVAPLLQRHTRDAEQYIAVLKLHNPASVPPVFDFMQGVAKFVDDDLPRDCSRRHRRLAPFWPPLRIPFANDDHEWESESADTALYHVAQLWYSEWPPTTPPLPHDGVHNRDDSTAEYSLSVTATPSSHFDDSPRRLSSDSAYLADPSRDHPQASYGKQRHVNGLRNCEVLLSSGSTSGFVGAVIRWDGRDPNTYPVDEFRAEGWNNPGDLSDTVILQYRYPPSPPATAGTLANTDEGTLAAVRYGDWCLPVMFAGRDFSLEGRPPYSERNVRTEPGTNDPFQREIGETTMPGIHDHNAPRLRAALVTPGPALWVQSESTKRTGPGDQWFGVHRDRYGLNPFITQRFDEVMHLVSDNESGLLTPGGRFRRFLG